MKCAREFYGRYPENQNKTINFKLNSISLHSRGFFNFLSRSFIKHLVRFVIIQHAIRCIIIIFNKFDINKENLSLKNSIFEKCNKIQQNTFNTCFYYLQQYIQG